MLTKNPGGGYPLPPGATIHGANQAVASPDPATPLSIDAFERLTLAIEQADHINHRLAVLIERLTGQGQPMPNATSADQRCGGVVGATLERADQLRWMLDWANAQLSQLEKL